MPVLSEHLLIIVRPCGTGFSRPSRNGGNDGSQGSLFQIDTGQIRKRPTQYP